MNVGESTVTVGEHATLGPVRIELHQPALQGRRREETPTEVLLRLLISEVVTLQRIQVKIYNHMTRPRWWQRLYSWVKRHVAS